MNQDIPRRERASPSDAAEVDMVGARFELVARMGTDDADTVLFRTSMAPGKLVPLHSHADPECFYVLGGRIEIFILSNAPGWREVETGRSLLVADGVKHAVRNPAAEPADILMATNGRLARFFFEAGRPVEAGAAFGPPTVEDVERLLRVSRAFGYWNASPAESVAITG